MRLHSMFWYLAALLLVMLGWVFGAIIAAGAWTPIREAQVTPLHGRFDAQGASVAVFTDLVQADRKVTCRAAAKGFKENIPASALDLIIDQEGNSWHLIALQLQGRDAMNVTCSPKDRRTDTASYGYATVTGFESRSNTGRGVAILGSAAGFVLTVATWWSRRQNRKQIASQQKG